MAANKSARHKARGPRPHVWKGPWSAKNCVIITRHEHLIEQGFYRQQQSRRARRKIQ
jgi:hypothetical protein